MVSLYTKQISESFAKYSNSDIMEETYVLNSYGLKFLDVFKPGMIKWNMFPVRLRSNVRKSTVFTYIMDIEDINRWKESRYKWKNMNI